MRHTGSGPASFAISLASPDLPPAFHNPVGSPPSQSRLSLNDGGSFSKRLQVVLADDDSLR